jgi:integrase/recombinase XerD
MVGVEGGHSHRLRDTFAVDLLQNGVSLETVSMLLGHNSIKVTQQHYARWVKTRPGGSRRGKMRSKLR